jgi:hypothetical protein
MLMIKLLLFNYLHHLIFFLGNAPSHLIPNVKLLLELEYRTCELIAASSAKDPSVSSYLFQLHVRMIHCTSWACS